MRVRTRDCMVRWFLGKNLSNFIPPFENSTTRTAIMYIFQLISCSFFLFYSNLPNWNFASNFFKLMENLYFVPGIMIHVGNSIFVLSICLNLLIYPKLEIVMNELRRFKHSADFLANSSHIIESAAILAS